MNSRRQSGPEAGRGVAAGTWKAYVRQRQLLMGTVTISYYIFNFTSTAAIYNLSLVLAVLNLWVLLPESVN
jgi:hypothetical protein